MTHDTPDVPVIPSVESIYRAFQPKVSAYVRSRVSNVHDAEELVSAVFFKVTQKVGTYDPAKASLSTWVYTITRNTVTDYYRTRKTALPLEDYLPGDTPAEAPADDALDALADALLALKERERDLIVLHYHMGHTLKTVAEMMGMSYINAKVIHRKALENLRSFYAAG